MIHNILHNLIHNPILLAFACYYLGKLIIELFHLIINLGNLIYFSIRYLIERIVLYYNNPIRKMEKEMNKWISIQTEMNRCITELEQARNILLNENK